MYVKYEMNADDDYRGNVLLVFVNENNQSIAYTEIEVPDADMTPLVETEIAQVKEHTGNRDWLTHRQHLQREIDRLADEIRVSHLHAGPMSILAEYEQTDQALSAWEEAGSDMNNVPMEVTCWAEAEGETVEWAIADIKTTTLMFRYLVREIRRIRLLGKAQMRNLPFEEIDAAFEQRRIELEALRSDHGYNS